MAKRVLLVEPYDVIADILVEILDQLHYETEVIESDSFRRKDLRAGEYHCVLINIDQNSTEWRDNGLRLAAMASQAGLAVVMIPDHETGDKVIRANGWLHLHKPFTINDIDDVITRAVAASTPRTPRPPGAAESAQR
jgi:DNA-binding NtrC family response regulator